MKSFNGIIKLIKEVEQYQRKRTMPLIWKGHTNNTCKMINMLYKYKFN